MAVVLYDPALLADAQLSNVSAGTWRRRESGMS